MNQWKEDCVREGGEYSTLPKQVFPSLLKKLLACDFRKAIVSGFEATGIYPTRYVKGAIRYRYRTCTVPVQERLIYKCTVPVNKRKTHTGTGTGTGTKYSIFFQLNCYFAALIGLCQSSLRRLWWCRHPSRLRS